MQPPSSATALRSASPSFKRKKGGHFQAFLIIAKVGTEARAGKRFIEAFALALTPELALPIINRGGFQKIKLRQQTIKAVVKRQTAMGDATGQNRSDSLDSFVLAVAERPWEVPREFNKRLNQGL
ncbi:hypothetical protein BBJ28_00007836 [Nothophytophthora sp. Chile5]|nr:hypothetical protein BBJ28_00007836 [Nothophytophthora sp. Chile5]